MKIDVCVVTKGKVSDSWLKNLEYLPVNNLIIDNSTPLLKARKNCIDKVETEWFLFLDDDVMLLPNWWQEAEKWIKPDVGAIQGREWCYGVGEAMDRELNRFRWQKPNTEVTGIGRGTTVNTLLRTEACKDWQPPELDLYAYEDWLLTQHVLAKGYRWLDVKIPSWHMRPWGKVFKAAYRDMKNCKQIVSFSFKADLMKRLVFAMLYWTLQVTYDWRPSYEGRRVKAYMVYQDLGCLLGLLFG